MSMVSMKGKGEKRLTMPPVGLCPRNYLNLVLFKKGTGLLLI